MHLTPEQQFELIKSLLLLLGGGLIGLVTSLVMYWLEGKREHRKQQLEEEKELTRLKLRDYERALNWAREGRKGSLRGARLPGMDLSGIDLNGADLQGANLRRANLLVAGLQGANLAGADLQGAILACANLQNAHLGAANLAGADLEGANMQEANLFKTDLKGAKLEQADLRGPSCLEPISLVPNSLGPSCPKGSRCQRTNRRGKRSKNST